MITVEAIDEKIKPVKDTLLTNQHVSISDDPTVFTSIYQAQINLAIWQRKLSINLQKSVSSFLEFNPNFRLEIITNLADVQSHIDNAFKKHDHGLNLSELNNDISELVEMFSYLFELNQVGLRLHTVDHAMCPKFHIDKVPCRLVTTYQGSATQWLGHEVVDHTKLGLGSNGLPDSVSGLCKTQENIKQMRFGDVALMKGALWQENENFALVHRSPDLSNNENRLLLTLDFIN